MALFFASALLLFLLKDVTCQILPYTTITNRVEDSNNITLRCIGQFGVGVPGAIFYRNGQQITNSSCLTAYPTGISSVLNVTLVSQECDGYFSCGVNGTLSEPKPLYACPVKNNSDRTELVEEGTSVLLTCDFYPSPINRYRTKWIRSPGSFRPTELNSTMDLQSYTENNPQQMTPYACQINPVHGCFDNAASPWGPTITIHFKERYGTSRHIVTGSDIQTNDDAQPPMITKDLNYTRYTNGDGVFSVSTSGTNLTHKWYKNDKLINGTGAGILDIGNDALTVEDSNGLLRITYEASNVDYNSMTHTTRQTFGLYSNTTYLFVNHTEEMAKNSMIAFNVVVPLLGLSTFALLITCIVLFCYIYYLKCTKEPRLKPRIEEAEPIDKLTIAVRHFIKNCDTSVILLQALVHMMHDATDARCINQEQRVELRDIRGLLEEVKDKIDIPSADAKSIQLDGHDQNQNQIRNAIEKCDELERIVIGLLQE